MDCVCRENSLSRPRSSVTLATTATRIAGAAATTENRATIRTCSRDAARPRRRACTMRHTSYALTATRKPMVIALASRRARTTLSVSGIGVRSASTMKVAKADKSASATAPKPRLRARKPAGGAAATVTISAVVAWPTVVMSQVVGVKGCRPQEAGDAFLQQCCRIATIPGRYNPQPCPASDPTRPSAAAAEHLDLEIADLLAQGIAINPEQVSGADLVAARGRKRDRQQRMLNLAQDAVIEAGRRQRVPEAGEIGGEVALDRR